jgi:hypothetical protein
MHLFSLLLSAVRGYFWPSSTFAAATPGSLPKGILLSGSVCSAICVVLSLMAILATQIAFPRVDPDNRLGLSQDGFYAMSGWSFAFGFYSARKISPPIRGRSRTPPWLAYG